MRLVNNGEYGLLVDVEYLKSLDTIDKLQQEIDACQNGAYVFVEREDNQVVYLEDYIIHLYEQLVKLYEQRHEQSKILVEKLSNHLRIKHTENTLSKESEIDNKEDKPMEVIDNMVDDKE